MSTVPPSPTAVQSPAAVAPALLERHKAALRSYVQALSKTDAAGVEGVVEAVWLEAQSAENAEFEEDPTVWLFARARRRVIGSGPRDALAGEAGGGANEDESGQEGEEPRVVVHRTIGSLTAKQQETLRLKFQFNLNLDEIASITGQAKSGTGGLLHHAVVRIGKALGAREDDSSPLANDPRVTAYALDEMDASERTYFEKGITNGKALLEREKAIREWGGHITTVLSSGAPVPRRRRKQRGAAWWKSGALGISLTLAAAAGLFWFIRPGISVSTGRQDTDQASGATQAGTDNQSGSDRDDRRPDAAVAGVAPENSASPRLQQRDAASPSSPGEKVTAGRQEGETSSLFANKESLGFRLGGKPGGGSAPGKTPPKKQEDSSDQATSFGKPEAVGPRTTESPPAEANSSALAARASRPSEARLETDLVNAQPGKGRAAEVVDPLPAMGAVQQELARKQWPKKELVRIGELLRRVPLVPRPLVRNPVETQVELVRSPWNARQQILRVGLRAKDFPAPARGPANLVFAIDVSRSMAGPNRLPLVQDGVSRLADHLRPDDIVSVITYAAKAGVILDALPAVRSRELRERLGALEADGLTNGSAGLELAYATARAHWIEGGLNVVVLCTDGNFNLGTTDETALAGLAAAQAAKGVRLSVFGFGRTDRNDLRLEIMASNGRGRSCYVNTREETERQLVEQIDGLFAPVARNVRLQVEFSPARQDQYRRIGDEPTRDTGGAVAALLPGRSVTALFELTPVEGVAGPAGLGRMQLAYTLPGTGERRQLTVPLPGSELDWARTGAEFRYAIALAEFGRILRDGRPADTAELDRLEAWVRKNLPEDSGGYRIELLQSLDLAKAVVLSQRAGVGVN